ncbi:MAG TPA: type II toxin-antitoxin system prevent-host-death family antitoxin [Candidatus Dormibacteraeota bacterium]|nr:type II toxin-antitoxin system prevent-host-death family antitoxin [Candidatus Dormibacteraeota bacterium]
MTKVVSIYQAKTNLSKLIKKAQAGETIYIGAYGQAQAVIAPAPKKDPIQIGVWAHKKKAAAYKPAELIGPDPEINSEFEKSLNQPL